MVFYFSGITQTRVEQDLMKFTKKIPFKFHEAISSAAKTELNIEMEWKNETDALLDLRALLTDDITSSPVVNHRRRIISSVRNNNRTKVDTKV